MQRVECLYRVSTKGQVDHDDIPMQRIECRKFAEQNGWHIIKELNEKGVSGYKVSADDRDAIQELRQDALDGKFDILLVFMFDRLGRRDDETPFVVEWFAQQGIRIFSTREGEQKFENHTDSLINYIRFWQSEGESKKTSIRIKARQDQMREEGLYVGGPVRYGYRAVNKGRLNKRNKPVADLEIDPEEAAVVKEIFNRTANQAAGTFILAKDLNARGYRTHLKAQFNANTIKRILQDRIYLGYLITKDVTSPHLPELQIIQADVFDRAQEVVNQRKKENAAWRNIPRQHSNGLLLAGNLYCASCGKRMTSSHPGEGAKREYPQYICYMGANRRVRCDGQRAYIASQIDSTVLQVTRMVLNSIKDIPKDESIETRLKHELKGMQSQLKEINKKYAEAGRELETYELEIAHCLLGESQFTPESLSKIIDMKTTIKKELREQQAIIEKRCNSQSEIVKGLSAYYEQFHGWSMEFGLADMERKRLIISQLFKRIEVGRGYKLKFEMDWNYEQFLRECDDPKPLPKVKRGKESPDELAHTA